KIVKSPLAFARLIKTNLMHRRPIPELLKPPPPRAPDQPGFEFGLAATRAVQRRRRFRAAAFPARAA
ncbi:hypothetical protein, partial [Bradyrhizobium sp.]|uniref:hypothetical protein n=1 Tax=Bradyrhizobium sp. TaxID=376 RepID=UPI00263577AD